MLKNEPRKIFLGSGCLFSLLIGICSAQGQVAPLPSAQRPAQAEPVLPVGVAVLPERGLSSFKLSGGNAEISVVPVEGQVFKSALSARTLKKPERDYEIQVATTNAAPVAKGDVIVAEFYLRTLEAEDETGEGQTALLFEGGPQFIKSLWKNVAAGREWKRFRFPFASQADYKSGEARIVFRLGYKPQTIEIGGFSLTNYRGAVKLSDFPQSRQTYAGREANAPWRQAAQERIEKLRKGDLSVRVLDRNGKPVPNAQIKVEMKRHAFGFGSVVNSDTLWGLENTPDGQKYRDTLLKLFNISVDEGAMKMPGWRNARSRERALKTGAWMKQNRMRFRGHALVWPSWEKSPSSLRRLYEETKVQKGEAAAKDVLRSEIARHIADIGGAFREQVVAWDVVNETWTNHDFQDILGKDALVEWFRLAKAADPNAKLFLNENSVLVGKKAEFLENEVRFLQERGAPLEGIGIQGHVSATLSIPTMLSNLDRFQKFNLPVHITEFDANAPGDEQLAGEFTRDFLTAAFSHPVVTDIVLWGFWEGRHWRPERALFRKDWSIKPNGQAYLDLVFKQWWTNAQGVSSAQGNYQTRGFLGDYEVTVMQNGGSKTVKTTLPKGGRALTVTLD